ncbi:hypothetical protein COO60DRAFT_293445 [Scenedesmus sp. NREL 46B-D3]|nr:hypothetical protein COO60DRAFT_293445 [Scenedesmus sp. NREL 46B-D3]
MLYLLLHCHIGAVLVMPQQLTAHRQLPCNTAAAPALASSHQDMLQSIQSVQERVSNGSWASASVVFSVTHWWYQHVRTYSILTWTNEEVTGARPPFEETGARPPAIQAMHGHICMSSLSSGIAQLLAVLAKLAWCIVNIMLRIIG